MADYKIVHLPTIAIIGKEGLCTEDENIVQTLWQEANSNFNEVSALGMKNPDGSFAGFWGAMSDESMSFLPWTNHYSRGLYLAGIEVNEDSAVPEGWKKWIMPSRTYLVTDVTPERYSDIFNEVLQKTLPEAGMKLSGAVCDYTEPASGQNKLFFPVERI